MKNAANLIMPFSYGTVITPFLLSGYQSPALPKEFSMRLAPAFHHFALTAGLAAAVLVSAAAMPATAAGPFGDFPGNWSGTGKIRVQGQDPERLRCKASYRARGSSGSQIDLQLSCDSDSYKFDLVGDFEVDDSNKLSGRWSENSRNVGGTAIGSVRGDRMQIHIESSAFSANLTMTTRGRSQKISFDAHGGGQVVDSSITLSR
jgi:hypothetical protein